MAYAVKELFYTIQGEGGNAGRAAVFCRFTGCNLWSGLEKDRQKAICQFCDTDFVGTDGPGGGRFANASALAGAIAATWAGGRMGRPLVVCTGGEPLLQIDAALIAELHERSFQVAVETNGTLPCPAAIDWICVSPKAGAPLKQTTGDELKLVYPQTGAEPERFADLGFSHFFLQPMDGPERETNAQAVVSYCKRYPQWRVSLQTHKMLGIP